MDTVIIILLIIFTAFGKIVFVDSWVYANLRKHRSKSYIRKHYRGIANHIFYKDFYREIKKVYIIINYLTIFAFAFLTVLLFISFFHVDISFFVNICLNILIFICILIAVYVDYDMIFNGIDTKGNKISIFLRIIYTIFTVAIFTAFVLLKFWYNA